MKKQMWLLAGLVALGLLIAGVTFTVNQNEYAVLTRFGKTVEVILEPGLNLKVPGIHGVYRFDKRLQLHEGLLLECLTRDKKNIAIRNVVVWRISEPGTFYMSVGAAMDLAAQKLDDLLTSKGAGAVGDFSFDELISVEHEVKIPELEERIKRELARSLEEGGYGMEIVSVEVGRLALPESNAYSVYQRMRKERNAIANKYRAEGEEEASKIRARADRERSVILSDAYEKAQKLRGEGEAEAARIYAEAFREDPEFYRFWRTLQSYSKILDEKTTLVITDDSEIMKYLGE